MFQNTNISTIRPVGIFRANWIAMRASNLIVVELKQVNHLMKVTQEIN